MTDIVQKRHDQWPTRAKIDQAILSLEGCKVIICDVPLSHEQEYESIFELKGQRMGDQFKPFIM